MKKRKGMVHLPTLVVVGSGILGIGGFLSYLKFQNLVEKGYVTIDTSPQVPSWLSTAIHAANMLPKEIPLKYLYKTLFGTEEEKNFYMDKIEVISQYFSVTIEEK